MKDFHFHWQNLNEDKFGRKNNPIKYGRCWWHFSNRKCLGFEWNLGKIRFNLGVNYGGFADSELTLIFCIPFISLYLSFENFFKRLRKSDADKHTGIAIHNGSIWIDIGKDNDGWNSKRDKFKHIVITPMDIIFGRMKYNKLELERSEANIPMNEGAYPAEICLVECTWKRKRLPFKKKIIRAEIEMLKPIPIPGKGENSWDCGENAIYSLTLPNKTTIAAAISGVVESCLRDRFKYGGHNWTPNKVNS